MCGPMHIFYFIFPQRVYMIVVGGYICQQIFFLVVGMGIVWGINMEIRSFCKKREN